MPFKDAFHPRNTWIVGSGSIPIPSGGNQNSPNPQNGTPNTGYNPETGVEENTITGSSDVDNWLIGEGYRYDPLGGNWNQIYKPYNTSFEVGPLSYIGWEWDNSLIISQGNYLSNNLVNSSNFGIGLEPFTVTNGASVDVTLAIGPVGFSLEVGSLEYNGDNYNYFSIGHANGLEASVSMNLIKIRDFQSAFTPRDYSGWSTLDNYSLTYFSYGRESALQYSESPYYMYGYNANRYSFGLGALPLGWSNVRSYTWVGKGRKRYRYKFYDFK